MAKTAVVYHYYEKNTVYRDNLIFFLATAILDDVDYYIILAGDCTAEIPFRNNIKTIKTANWNYDFGGYTRFVQHGFPDQYKHFVFVNSSVRGPFLASYSSQSWIDIFTNKLTGDVHLVGASINLVPTPHVQTTAYAMTAKAMHYLMSIGFYDIDRSLTKGEAIGLYELRMSRELINKGWNITTFLPIYGEIDYRKQDHSSSLLLNADVLFRNGFFGRTLCPPEAMFVKVNRNMISDIELASYTFTALCSGHAGATLVSVSEANELRQRSYQEVSRAISRERLKRQILNPLRPNQIRKVVAHQIVKIIRRLKSCVPDPWKEV